MSGRIDRNVHLSVFSFIPLNLHFQDIGEPLTQRGFDRIAFSMPALGQTHLV